MPGKFVPFDIQVIDREFNELKRSSVQDAVKLIYCFKRYEGCGSHENPHPAIVKRFDEGFGELRHTNNAYAGRLLFYEPPRSTASSNELVILRVFRKEGQVTPKREREIAERRMGQDLERRRKERG